MMRAAWVGGRNMRGFREAFSKFQKLLAQFGVGRALLDLNTLPEVSVYDQLWLSTVFMPSLLLLPLQKVVVVLSPKNVYNHQMVEGLLMAVQLLIRFDVQFFAQPDAAMQWITDYSPRLPILQQEWNQHCAPTSRNTDEVAEPQASYTLRKPLRLPS
ncbi:hypothetical protein A8B98_09320 [Hymenobacter sp. UV11]|nr:hypothetical protein A8B98_09320 [Hymenobacter sp. UV11]